MRWGVSKVTHIPIDKSFYHDVSLFTTAPGVVQAPGNTIGLIIDGSKRSDIPSHGFYNPIPSLTMPVILRKPDPSDNEWSFQGIQLPKTRINKNGEYCGLLISFTPDAITLDSTQFPSNRILQTDNKELFILVSFGSLRFPDVYPSVNIEYIKRVLKAGLHINGRHFWFYGHSNSQLRSRSCFFREAANEDILHRKILAMGNFESIKSPAKRAGISFSV
jgi:hypothetical protein